MPTLHYSIGDFKLDLRENLGYFVEDMLQEPGAKINRAAFDREKFNLADSLYITLISKMQESIDIYRKEELFPHLDLREMSIAVNDPINLN